MYTSGKIQKSQGRSLDFWYYDTNVQIAFDIHKTMSFDIWIFRRFL